MTQFETAAQETAATDLDDRDARALTDYLLVVEEVPDLYLVYGEQGDEYTVDIETGACTCPDAEYRQPEGGCKHARRVAFHTGERAVPSWVDRDAVDPLLADRLGDADAATQAVATDGGEIVVAEDDGEILDDTPAWDGPFTEYDAYGCPTGAAYVRCPECGLEVMTGDTDRVSHREGCSAGEGE